MLQDPNVERYVQERIEPLQEQIKELQATIFNLMQANNLHLQNVSVSLPSREDYDKRQLNPMYFKLDTSVGNSVLYIKGDEYEPYQWNYSRMIDLLKEGRLGYER